LPFTAARILSFLRRGATIISKKKSPDEPCGAFSVNFNAAGQEKMGRRVQGEALMQV
jgi:hypothetical protein